MRRALPFLAVAFCAGAAFRLWVRVDVPSAFLLLAFAGFSFLALSRWATAALVSAIVLVATLAVLRTALWCETPADCVSLLEDRRWIRLHGFAVSEPAERGWGTVFDLSVYRADTRREPLEVSGKVRVLIPPDGPPPPSYGQQVTVEGRVRRPDDAANPGEIPPAQYLRRDGVCAVLTADSLTLGSSRQANPMMFMALRTKTYMVRGIDQTLEPERAAMLKGLLFSDSAALPEELREAFARSGTVHILSTSGVHVAVLAGLVAMVWRSRRPRDRKFRAVLLIAALLLFGFMTGLRPAVTRAIVMTVVVLAAPLFDREPDVWCAIALSALLLVAWSPGNLLDPGFQLSYAAVIALAAWFEGLPRHDQRPRWWKWIGNAVTVSLVASAATSPLAAVYFGVFSIASPISNLLVVPAVGPAMALGMIQGLFWSIFPPAANAAAWLNGWFLEWILGSTRFIAAWRWSAVETGLLPPVVAMLGLLILSCVTLSRRVGRLVQREEWQDRARNALAAGMAAGFIALAWVLSRPGELTITFLDVGAADCAFIRTAGGRTVLVDSGGRPEGADSRSNVGERVVVPALKRAGTHSLDIVILTHPHEDHAGGLPAVLTAIPVRLVVTNGEASESPGYQEAMRIAAEQRIPVKTAGRGDVLQLEPGVALEFLWPGTDTIRGTSDDVNNNSLVFRLLAREGSVLFTGDAQREAETRMLAEPSGLKADVLKVAHHGSRTSSGPSFVARVSPAFAIVSTSASEREGLPAPEIVHTLESTGAQVLRTDEDGGIVVRWRKSRPVASTNRWTLP